ncbi:metallophosphoesterase [Dyadobacter sp. CY345]|uniref:metallophosphoesterase n=1 Tax=Dyadobacter sp. CY345 TaxID=2909335 RepID=UPI001F435C5B|nr:metallophosphoesterase [Dyadobacter sp. CY345]MCF2447231.1 metallophosphoesterase [Dyadobacter sp. CY345]
MRRNLLLPLFLLFLIPSYGQLIRGPYLQVATSISMVIRWRTDVAATSRVQFGNTSNNLDKKIEDNALVTEHEIKLTGLTPMTKYFYSIGSLSTVYQGDPNNYFETTPIPGTKGKYRFGVLGDCGTNSAFQGNVRDQLTNYLGKDYMNALLLLGDNAYSQGKDPEYQSNFFNHYKDNFLKKFPVFPTPGNHDYGNDDPNRQIDHKIPYYDIFTLPVKGESGGVPSENEAYYSYDYGNVHFLSLDSYGKEDQSTRLYDTLGKQVQWIKADLAANKNKDWVVAYWHHPPFSLGSRNGETENDMIKIRENFIRILERNGVDLILCGHSHVYERTRLIQGFYNYSGSFNNAVHNVSQSSGKYDGSDNSCTYIKSSNANKGTVYVVTGSAGQLGSPSPGFPHKAMYYSNAELGGSLMLEVEGNRLDAKWVGIDGQIRDKFTIVKDVNQNRTIEIESGKSVNLEASFNGQYVWSTGANSRTISVTPNADADYTVKDVQNCLTDVFHVKVTKQVPVKLISLEGVADTRNIVKLNWATEFETQFSHFQVERSFDATNFSDLGRVNSNQNSKEKQSYEFFDQSGQSNISSDTIYYRLKMVNLAGSFEFSKTIGVKLNQIVLGTDPTTFLDIAIVPNPSTHDDVQVKLLGKDRAVTEIMILDISGKTLLSKPMTLTKDLSPFLPKGLTKGIYFLKVTIDNRTITKKFVIL